MIRIAQFSDLHYGTKTLTEADRCFGAAIDRAIALGVQVAVVSGDATDHALDLHAPAAERLFAQVRRLADHCPVLMLQGTFSHEPPGTLAIFRFLGGRHPVHVAERIGLTPSGHSRVNTAAGTIQVQTGQIETLAMGPLTLYDLPIFINPAAGGDEILVGMNALGRLELRQKDRQLLLRPLQE